MYKDVERCDTCQYVEGLFDSHWGSVSLRNFHAFLSASFYQKIQQTMQIQEISWFVGFSGKSLAVLAT